MADRVNMKVNMLDLDQEKWDNRFLDLCEHVSEWSKDPSTKVGAVITEGIHIVSIGYNGLPSGYTMTQIFYITENKNTNL